MQEEIKEILDRLKDSVTNPIIDVPVMGGVSEPIDNSQCLEPNECKILLDYITNLQEYETIIEMEFKREYAKRYLEERRKEEPHLLYPDSDEIYKRYYELKEENERLTQGVTLLTNKLIDMTKEKEIYKSRNEKAIEYINHENFKRTILVGVSTKKYTRNILDNVLNILQGVDKE